MGEYIFSGDVKLSGVTFFVTADSEEDAIKKAEAGEWDDYETGGATTAGCHINVESIESND